ncbi:MAG: reactive intermediate/imine deaminase [Chloroflexota bacterium]
MPREVISTAKAPAAIGPYSQAVKVGNMVFVSGQIPLDPETGQLVAGGIEEQTRRVLLNLQAILEAAGLGLNEVVRTTVFLADLADFPKMNQVYAEFFGNVPPARTTVQAAALPRGALIEVDAIAVAEGGAGG